jgi:hypothetical protein
MVGVTRRAMLAIVTVLALHGAVAVVHRQPPSILV